MKNIDFPTGHKEWGKPKYGIRREGNSQAKTGELTATVDASLTLKILDNLMQNLCFP